MICYCVRPVIVTKTVTTLQGVLNAGAGVD